MCPNTEFFLVLIFLYSNWIQENTDQKKLRSKSPYSVQIQENANQKKLRFWTLFTQIYYVNLRIQYEYRKIQTRKNSVFGQFSRSVNWMKVPNDVHMTFRIALERLLYVLYSKFFLLASLQKLCFKIASDNFLTYKKIVFCLRSRLPKHFNLIFFKC